jgi:hypothetical protein
MPRLLVSGDSWTSGWPLEQSLGHRDFAWPRLVSQHFGFDLIDKSRAGSSNFRIYRKAFDGLISGDIDCVLVFLTNWSRFETGANYGPKPGRIYQHIVNDSDSDEAFRRFFNGYKNYTDMLRQIIALQCVSVQRQIPCFFLDTFDHNIVLDISMDDFIRILQYNFSVFDNMDDDRIADKYRVVKTLTQALDLDNFISTKSYQSLIAGCVMQSEHPVESGHRVIADTVIKFLESKLYGQTF